jgi:mono/diheme cytochrome c family protein
MKLVRAAAGVLLAAATVAAVIAVGAIDVAADRPHWRITERLLETVRDRGIAVRARRVASPDLDSPKRISRGAGNYDAMCSGCHLQPGVVGTELSRTLYPRPPALTGPSNRDPGEVFWIIKHGIKMTGMPAWGAVMPDEAVWDLVALLRRLPSLDPEEYANLVHESDGHVHSSAIHGHFTPAGVSMPQSGTASRSQDSSCRRTRP